MAEDPLPQLPPGLQWAPTPGAPPPDAPAPDIPVLPPGMQWRDYPGRGGISVHPSEQIPQMPGPPPGPTGFERFFTAEGRAIDPTTKQPYREIRELTADLPQNSIGFGDKKEISSMMMFEPDEKNRAEYILKKFPNAKLRTEGREIIVDIPDIDPRTGKPFGPFTMNQVGMSPQDFDEIVREVTLMGPTARLAGLGSSVIRRSLLAGVGTGATEAVRQGVSMIGGARKDISVPDVLISGGAAAVLNGISEPAFGLLRRAFATRALTDVNGQMTPQGRLILTRIGVDPDTVTLQMLREIEPLVARARTPEEALRLAQARSLDVPVTRGDITRDPKMSAVEQRVAMGGTHGTSILPHERRLFEMKRPGGAQDEALAAALTETSRRVTATPRNPRGIPTEFDPATTAAVTPKGESFGRTQEVLVRLLERSRANVSRYYQQAEAGNVAMMPNKVSPLSREFQLIKESTNNADAKAIADEVAGEIKKAIAGGQTPITLNRMELIRKKISEFGASNDGAVREVGGRLRRAYDNWERNLVPDAGDPAAIAAYQRGRELRILQAANFDDDPAISAMLRATRINSPVPGGRPTYQIEIQPSEAVDMILGSGLGKKGAANSALRLRNLLGEDSESWQMFKREVFQRISEKGAGHFESRWNKFLRDQPELADIVFPRPDQGHMGTMAGVAGTTRPVPGAKNYPGTAYELARQLPLSNLGQRVLVSAVTGANPQNAMRPIISSAAPFPVRLGAAAVAESAGPPHAETVAKYLLLQSMRPRED